MPPSVEREESTDPAKIEESKGRTAKEESKGRTNKRKRNSGGNAINWAKQWPSSSRLCNFWTVGMQLMFALDATIFSDGVMSIVLAYFGSVELYTYKWSKRNQEPNELDDNRIDVWSDEEEAKLFALAESAKDLEQFDGEKYPLAHDLWTAFLVDNKTDLLNSRNLKEIEAMLEYDFYGFADRNRVPTISARLEYMRSLTDSELHKLEKQVGLIRRKYLTITPVKLNHHP